MDCTMLIGVWHRCWPSPHTFQAVRSEPAISRKHVRRPCFANAAIIARPSVRPNKFPVYCRLPCKMRFDCRRSEDDTSELQYLMRLSYVVLCLEKKQCHITS